ncbi:PPE protein [Mycolicibacterium rhodesiae JS60]|nr:PPE protein [Mycolicibacterium rhodesiae JS60]
MAVGLWVEVDEVHAAGTRMAHTVAAPISVGSTPVAPAAADQVSATVAAGLSTRLQTVGAYSARAAQITSAAAATLHSNAGTYAEQEDLNAAMLRPGGTAQPALAGAASVRAPAVPAPVPVVAASVPAGITPTDGKSIATLIHGGSGPEPLLAAATEARAHAAELRQISTSLGGISDRLAVDWRSGAAETATTGIATLAGWYDRHAEHTAAIARACEAQADSFSRTRAAVPKPEVFEDLERRLTAAARANALPGSMGRYTPVITQLQTQLAATHAQAVRAYADYTTRAADLPTDTPTPPPSTVHALDNPLIPQAPPPDPSYPVNDVIGEATDLDGNHVILRRGYYDAPTKEGFGWDKIYWKHNLINPNVFQDLISHSRPISNQNGTLVYEVPINRAHCTSGLFGLPSCTDTGESLTMRIVANTNPSVDVPGGGQKGVITMYPLAGGSGVVEVEPNWTLTPPWVNNYAPIN